GVLPKVVVPSRYALTLDLDPVREEFSGKASIAISVRKSVASIAVHAHELVATGVSLTGTGGARTLSVTADPKTQTWRLAPDDAAPIAEGNYTLDIAYTGVVHRSGEGLYRADYSVQGKATRMLATQLEARFARTLFPGFDEPVFRAVFDIAVRAPKEYDVVSNMPVSSKVSEGNTDLHRFQPTPPMPSYLVTVAVGRFDVLMGEAAGIPLRILSAEGKREQSQYAMDVTKQVLPFYTAYFRLPYALPKLDQLAVPSTRWGAMEDWGMISYSEPYVLFDPAKSGPDTQRDVFAVIAHEVAHQWFGNLVTASSWDEIWLNEAFATWLERKTSAEFNPTWQIPLRQRLPIDRAMTRDAGTATRAIRSGPVNESSVFDVFDDITYTKGGAVLSMLELWVGPDAFRRGLTAYLTSQKYSNATAGDLWHHMSYASGQDVSAVAATWTDQQGFPVVQVRTECKEGKTRVTLAQSRFTTAPTKSSAQVWKIPVSLSRGGDVTTLLFDTAQASFDLDGCLGEPLLANAGGKGFYRVEYDRAHLRALASRFLRLSPSDRVTLLSDTCALAQAGRGTLASYFTLLAAIPQVNGADRATLFSMASEGLAFLDDAMAATPMQRKVRAAGRLLFAPELSRLGWVPGVQDDLETLQLRGLLISQLARFDDRSSIEGARQLFDLDESGTAMLSASIRAPVMEAVGTHADRARFDQLLARLKSANSEEDRWIYAHALAAGRNARQAREFLFTSLVGVAAPNIASSIPRMVSERSPFKAMAYSFTLTHWEQLATLSGDVGKVWLLPSAASKFNDLERAKRLLVDQRRKAGEDGASPAARTAARIQLLSAVKRRDAAGIEKYLASWLPAN
ncbi:MAG TPA: M1 family aminopeptidase, partial [Casimicrobiaceae bacterium]|nr:M1 family aminopeptidase [Casimicrobiaceae bacterium]